MATKERERAGGGRERLLRAADECFRSGGYTEIGVAMLLERAGVQAPTLYHHFRDKEELYVAWSSGAWTSLAGAIDEAVRPELPTEPALIAYAWVLLERRGLDVQQMLRDVEAMVRPESKEELLSRYLQGVQSRLIGILLKGVARGELADVPLSPLSEAFLGGLYSVGRTAWAADQSSEDVAAWWVNLFLKGASTGLPRYVAVVG
jgi:AcrR family transcriptional regulator